METPNPDPQVAGVRYGDKGTHTSRTMMLAELSELLSALPATSTREDYADAIIEENILGKQTASTRKLTNLSQHLVVVLRGLEQSIADPGKGVLPPLRTATADS